MKEVKVEIQGTRPLLFHAFKIEAISALSKVKSGTVGNNPEEWKDTVLEQDGQLYIPGSYIRGCLIHGARFTKAGRGTLQKSFTSAILMKSDISLIDRYLPDGWRDMTHDQMPLNSDAPVYLDIRGVMNPNSKGRNIRYRVAASPGWKASFEFEFDDTIMSESQVKKIVEDSGKMGGVGDGIVLGYGRFKIKSISINECE